MTYAALPADHAAIPPARTAVLLVNLGTPDGTGYWPMRRYLREFLSDRRVIELNPLLWQPILHGPILTFRPRKSGRLYDRIWNREADESPLRTITRAQADAVALVLTAAHPDLRVAWAMRYGRPAVGEVVGKLVEEGCRRLLVLPLYPQYSAATTATACDAVFRRLMAERWQPAVRTAPPYHDDDGYIAALAGSVQAHLAALDWQPDMLLASFHGMPKRTLTLGDPYHCQCVKTARLLGERLDWPADRLTHAFQSRFGPAEWLQPYTDAVVASLPAQGVRNLAVICPGFSADCLETLEEIADEVQHTFRAAGGRNFTYIPCLNDSPAHIDMIAALCRRELAGWI